MSFFDAALVFDASARRCDLEIGADGDLLIDETPIPAILISVGLDRRAEHDDPLPQGRTDFLTPASYSQRRGSPCDGLDPDGERTGSRCWLLDRAKKTETTRLLFEFWLREALDWAAPETGIPAAIEVNWLDGARGTGRLGYRVQVEDYSVNLSSLSFGQS